MGLNLATIKPAVLKAKNVATVNDIEIAEASFNAAIATTNSYVATINNTLLDIASDAKLTAGEKQAVKREWETIVAEKTSLVNQATSFGTSSTVYTDKYNALDSYLNAPIGSALLTSLVTTSDIVSSTFTTKFKEYYTAKIDLLNALAAKAKEIADSKVDSTYVTTAIANSGYVLPADVAAAVNNNTTTIEGSKITTGSISASKINTQGLIAENISATDIIGKTITGGSIYGAYLEGAVIKASYIDLDGELQVLTNYHIPVSSYNPSTMPGAIYIASTNEYRLPSLSSIFIASTSLSVDRTGPQCPYSNMYGLSVGASATQNGVIYLYDSYQYTTSLRFVKQRPVISINQNTTILSFTARSSGTYMNIDLYFAGIYLGRFESYIGGCSFNGVSVSDSSTNAYAITSGVITSKGFSFTISTNAADENYGFGSTGYWLSFNSLNMLSGQITLTEDVSANYGFKAVVVARAELCTINSPSFVTPNMNILNML